MKISISKVAADDYAIMGEVFDLAKVILLCGKICSGKTTYANTVRNKSSAVILSVDEIMLALFGQNAGEKHDDYAAALKKYLLDKSIELVGAGIDVIIDTGLWSAAERNYVRKFYSSEKIENEIHYIDITDEEWKRRIEKRNKEISEGSAKAYYINEGLADKADKLFEKPDKAEVDVWVQY